MNLVSKIGKGKQSHVVCIFVSVIMVKSHERKSWNYFFKIITVTTVWWNVAEMWILKKCILIFQQKKWWILSTVRNIYEIYQTKYYYDIVKKSKFWFSWQLQIDKKINDVKEDPRRKTDSNFNFSQATECFWGLNQKEYYVMPIIELLLDQKRLK